MTSIARIATQAARHSYRCFELLAISMTAISSASAAETAAQAQTPALLHWTSSIDMRAAFLTSAISILILFFVGKIDFKSPFGIWGGRLIIFMLVILNIALWSTQV